MIQQVNSEFSFASCFLSLMQRFSNENEFDLHEIECELKIKHTYTTELFHSRKTCFDKEMNVLNFTNSKLTPLTLERVFVHARNLR